MTASSQAPAAGPSDAPEVVVVGAGIVGICCALQLQLAGARVTVLDRAAPGEGASYGNGAVIDEGSVIPVATPGILKQLPKMLLDPLSPLALRWSYLPKLAPWLRRFLAAARPAEVERISRALAKLQAGTLDSYAQLLEAAGAPEMLQRRGWLCVYQTEAGYRAYTDSLELQRRRGVQYEVLPPEELRQLEPALGSSERFHAGLYYPDVGHVTDNFRLVQVLAQALQDRGGRISREEVRGFAFGAEGPEQVVTDRDRHAFDRVVIAAGAWSRDLVRQLGSDLPLDTERGYHLTLPASGVQPRMPVFSTERAMVSTPVEGGLRLAGTVELGGLDAPPDWRRADLLLNNARGWYPDLDGAGASRWMGFRPSMPDSLPVISLAPRHRNAIFAFGHGHCGLMMGARTGELVRDLALNRTPSLDLTPFRADRF
jgi:D-amino-acid dehydrogenase